MAEHAHEAALVGLASDIAREIEAHDAFDCPEGWTYVRAANAIAMRLVERFVRPAPDPSSQSERIAVLEAALREKDEALDWLMSEIEGQRNLITHPNGRRAHHIDSQDEIRVELLTALLDRARSALAPLGEE